MARSVRSTSRLVFWSLWALVIGCSLVRADEPRRPEAETKMLAIAKVVGHLAAQRPEEVLGMMVLLAPNEPAAEPVTDVTGLKPGIRIVIGAASVIGTRDSLTDFAMIRHGYGRGVWVSDADAKADPPRKKWREAAVDPEKLNGIEQGTAIKGIEENRYEASSFDYLLVHAHEVPQDAMAQAADPELTYTNLVEEPFKNRGAIVLVVGRLRQLRKSTAPKAVWADGIKNIYEGLVISESRYTQRYCVIFTELPAGVKVGDDVNYPISFYAYLFKRYFVENPKDNKRRAAPLLVAHTFSLRNNVPVDPPDETLVSSHFLPTILVFFLATIIMTIVLFLWYRRSDRMVRTRLSDARGSTWVAPPPDKGPEAGSSLN